METPILSSDEGDYTSKDEVEAEPRKVKALGQPITRVMRQSRGGRNCVKQGMTDEKNDRPNMPYTIYEL